MSLLLPRYQQGFTLLELLITLVIATLLLSLVAPRLVAVIPSVQLKTETGKVVSWLKYARSRAVAEGIPVEVYPYQDETGAGLMQSGSNRRYRWPDSMNVELAATERVPTILFFPNGSASGGEVRLQGAERQYRVKVDWLTGRVSVDD